MKTYIRKAKSFIDEMHRFVEEKVELSESENKLEAVVFRNKIVPVIEKYLSEYFHSEKEAHDCFIWEGKTGYSTRPSQHLFTTDAWADGIISKPYIIAIEYKQGRRASLIKQCIGQSIFHWAVEEYDFCYTLFWDRTPNKKIKESMKSEKEKQLIDMLWYQHRTALKVL